MDDSDRQSRTSPSGIQSDEIATVKLIIEEQQKRAAGGYGGILNMALPVVGALGVGRKLFEHKDEVLTLKKNTIQSSFPEIQDALSKSTPHHTRFISVFF